MGHEHEAESRTRKDALKSEFVIESIADIEEARQKAVARLGLGLWWRGQADMAWDPLPKAYRRPYAGFEEEVYRAFVALAGPLSTSCPTGTDPEDWLPLAQHYGLPTRLLDWTASPSVAAFFAVEAHHPFVKGEEPKGPDSAPAALYALNPLLLNKAQVGEPRRLPPRHEKVLPIFRAVTDAQVRGKGHDGVTAALLMPHSDLRMTAQLAGHTIHGSTDAMHLLPGAGDFLMWFEIPCDSSLKARPHEPQRNSLKRDLEIVLTNYGVSRYPLFPDLANLAAHLTHACEQQMLLTDAQALAFP